MLQKELRVIYSDEYLKWDFGIESPISQDKTTVFLKEIRKSKIRHKILAPQKATDEDILLVHPLTYLRDAKQLAADRLELGPDTPINLGILEAAYYYVGGTILCLNVALQGERVVNLIGGMHHTGISHTSGFCIFNDQAIAIRKLQNEGKIRKVTIYDLDVHAGQGTQEIFYSDANVLTVSMHQDPHTIYPGTGFGSQQGEKQGLGKNINITLPPGTGEIKYLQALDSVLKSTADFSPDLTVLLLGVDTYKNDLLGGLSLEQDSFRKIGQRFQNFPKLAVLFGGGYSREIPSLWIKFLKGYLEK